MGGSHGKTTITSMLLLNRGIKKMTLPIIDYVLVLVGLFLIAHQYMRVEEIIIPSELMNKALPIYSGVWLLTSLFSGGYDKPIRISKNSLGAFLGTGIILMVYALLPKDLQFSRLIILLGGIWVLLYFILSRVFLHFAIGKAFRIGGEKNKCFAIVGDLEEVERVSSLLYQTNSRIQGVKFVSSEMEHNANDFVGNMTQLDQVVDIEKIDEVIFCAKNISAEMIISTMLQLEGRKLDFKIAQPETSFLIGSNSIDSQGDLYVMDINRINKPANRRNKRVLDFFGALFLLVFSPILVWFYSQKGRFFRNLFGVLFGKLSFVGYTPIDHISTLKLPKQRRGVLTADRMVEQGAISDEDRIRLNLIYAKNHSYLIDFKILVKHWRALDQ